MRTEAAALYALGYTAQASDLIRSAQQLESAAPASMAPASTMTLKRGSSGNDVRAWQTFLVSQGYTAVTVDGDFGVQTEDSTKAFQAKRGLKADGIVGPETLRVLAEDADARTTLDVLRGTRSIVDVRIYVWRPKEGEWELLTFDERKILWDLRQADAS